MRRVNIEKSSENSFGMILKSASNQLLSDKSSESTDYESVYSSGSISNQENETFRVTSPRALTSPKCTQSPLFSRSNPSRTFEFLPSRSKEILNHAVFASRQENMLFANYSSTDDEIVVNHIATFSSQETEELIQAPPLYQLPSRETLDDYFQDDILLTSTTSSFLAPPVWEHRSPIPSPVREIEQCPEEREQPEISVDAKAPVVTADTKAPVVTADATAPEVTVDAKAPEQKLDDNAVAIRKAILSSVKMTLTPRATNRIRVTFAESPPEEHSFVGYLSMSCSSDICDHERDQSLFHSDSGSEGDDSPTKDGKICQRNTTRSSEPQSFLGQSVAGFISGIGLPQFAQDPSCHFPSDEACGRKKQDNRGSKSMKRKSNSSNAESDSESESKDSFFTRLVSGIQMTGGSTLSLPTND